MIVYGEFIIKFNIINIASVFDVNLINFKIVIMQILVYGFLNKVGLEGFEEHVKK